MKKISKIILGLLCLVGFTTSVKAVNYYYDSSITANITGDKYEYISGLPIYYNTSYSYPIYVLNNGTYFDARTTLTNPREVSEAFAYIVSNANVTNNSYKNYYIAQVAILWYQDYLNGNNNNVSESIKAYISNHTNDTVCYYINKLVNNAKNYATTRSNIKFLDESISFTRNGNYYYSNIINVETNNLTSTPYVRLYNAPTSATIVNNTVPQNGVGSFQISIPTSSMSNLYDKDFEVYITARGTTNTVLMYSYNGTTDVIYGRTYSSSTDTIEASMPANVRGINNTRVRFKVVDREGNSISGLQYSIYRGDCTNTSCTSEDLVQSFTTNTTYNELNNLLSEGIYTLVNRYNYYNHSIPSRLLINIVNSSDIQEVTIEEGKQYYNNSYDYTNYPYGYNNYDTNYNYNYNYNYNNTSSTVSSGIRKVNIVNNIGDSTDIIKVYTKSNILIDSFRSSNTNYSVSLGEGEYYIVDTNNYFNRIYFKIANYGKLYIYTNNEYTETSYINIVKETVVNNNTNNSTNNNTTEEKVVVVPTQDKEVKYDEKTKTYYVDGLGTVEIKNEVDTKTDVEVEWLSNIIDTPITSLSATLKYVIGAIILAAGTLMFIKCKQKQK